MATNGPKQLIHKEFRLPPIFSIENFESALKFQPKPNTIFICTYPKCGTTWMQNIVYLLLHDGKPLPPNGQIGEVIPFLELKGSEFCDDKAALKTHLPSNLLNWSDHAKYIFVARNPKDACVSFFHHMRGFVSNYDYANGTFDDYFPRYMSGEVDFGNYFDYFASWQPRIDDPNVFFCTYEEMIGDIRSIIKKVAAFLDFKLDDSLLEKVVEHSSFPSMQKDLQRWHLERPKDMPPFIRKGEIGDWKNYFSEEQSELMNKKIEEYPLMKTLWAQYI